MLRLVCVQLRDCSHAGARVGLCARAGAGAELRHWLAHCAGGGAAGAPQRVCACVVAAALAAPAPAHALGCGGCDGARAGLRPRWALPGAAPAPARALACSGCTGARAGLPGGRRAGRCLGRRLRLRAHWAAAAALARALGCGGCRALCALCLAGAARCSLRCRCQRPARAARSAWQGLRAVACAAAASAHPLFTPQGRGVHAVCTSFPASGRAEADAGQR
jgi:hypothetical protein